MARVGTRADGSTTPENDAVQVAVRVRPLSLIESSQGATVCVDVLDTRVILGDKQFDFDAAYPAAAQQEHMFTELVLPMLDQYFDGYNATVFAYGQTGSGKTYTIGNEFASSIASSDRGIISRVIENIFERIHSSVRPQHFVIKLSYLEILNQEIRDLLASDTLLTSSGLSVRGDGDRGIVVHGLSEHIVQSIDEAEGLLRSGALLRATASTSMNSHSSRSHAICTVTMELRDVSSVEGGTETRVSKFHLVDLAGSERVRRTHSEGVRFKEGVNINRGLLALGNVINALYERSRTHSLTIHIPYRDSKLTRLLQDSLGGNSKTLMIACVSPAHVNYEETANTLRYALRTRNIENKAVINMEHRVENEVTYLKQQLEIVHLQLLQQTQGVASDILRTETVHAGPDIRLLLEKNRKLREELYLAKGAKDKWKMLANELAGHSKTVHIESRTCELSQISALAIKPGAGIHNNKGSTSSQVSRLERLREFQRQKSIASKDENIAVQRSDGAMALRVRGSLPSSRTDTTSVIATKLMRPSEKNHETQSMKLFANLVEQVVESHKANYLSNEGVRAYVGDQKSLTLGEARGKTMPSIERAEQLAKLQEGLGNKTDNNFVLQQASVDDKVSLPSGIFPAKVDTCHDLIQYLIEMLVESKKECWALSSCRMNADIEKLMAERRSYSKQVLELEGRLVETVKKLEVLQHPVTRKKPRKRSQRESYETIETLFSSSDDEEDNNAADSDYVEDERYRTKNIKRRKGRSMTTIKKANSGEAMDGLNKTRSASAACCCNCHGKCATKACECKSQSRICSGDCSCNLKKCRNRRVDDIGVTLSAKLHTGSADLAITSFVPSTLKRPATSEATSTAIPA